MIANRIDLPITVCMVRVAKPLTTTVSQDPTLTDCHEPSRATSKVASKVQPSLSAAAI